MMRLGTGLLAVKCLVKPRFSWSSTGRPPVPSGKKMLMWCKALSLFQILKETPSILSLVLKLAQNFIPLSPASYYDFCFLLRILDRFLCHSAVCSM